MLNRVMLCLLAVAGFVTSAAAQQRPVCGTHQHLLATEQKFPKVQAKRTKVNALIADWQIHRQQMALRGTAAIITIPVVVHVVHSGGADSISVAQVQSQVDALNRDFARRNSDTVNTPALFKPVAADTEIRFCLASRTPDGDPTNGITYTRTASAPFTMNDNIKFNSRGGIDAWDTQKYLNLWVGELPPNLLGYAQYPGGGSFDTDGVVIDYRAFGTTGTAGAPYNLGRTTVHEVGHWLDLSHIWGDALCGNDNVADTPTQLEENFGCPAFPKPSCGNTSDMFMNYMDYTDDACMNLFTQGQKDRMHAAINVSRTGLLTSDGCVPVVMQPLDASILRINSPSGHNCQTTFVPEVVLKNSGTTTLDSVTINFQVNSGPVQTYLWRGQLTSLATTVVVLPQQAIGPGNHTFTAFTSLPNGGTDNRPANDSKTVNFRRSSLNSARALPYSEGFEGTLFPPAEWELQNPDRGITWQRTLAAAKSGSASARVLNYDYDASNEYDELVMPPLDLSSGTNPILTFHLAYASYTTFGSDSLEVLASVDCGLTYTSLYKKGGNALRTASPAVTSASFVPAASDWRSDTVSLAAFTTYKNVILKFRNITDFENNLYLDDVAVLQGPTGVKGALAPGAVTIYPNPTSGIVWVEAGQLP
ncbi:MAG: zinc metalloprotease, partial [Hymenobacteraceae bacterium]|nr:zinc metalloprotease [Hymenobacteraceae bacterium]MDX5395395.1 zinc metalloprotease [Hymenobacteraceae bacterium]MDX5511444.1 zinc metalloprotease [Hymenobacteraceae bacterium]